MISKKNRFTQKLGCSSLKSKVFKVGFYKTENT